MKACIICLNFHVPVSYIGNSAEILLDDVFEKYGFPKVDSHHFACLQCKSLLTKANNFIQRALRAQRALQELLTQDNRVTYDKLIGIDRTILNLNINLIQEKVYSIEIFGNEDEAKHNVHEDDVRQVELESECIEDCLKGVKCDDIVKNETPIDPVEINETSLNCVPNPLLEDVETQSDEIVDVPPVVINIDSTDEECCSPNSGVALKSPIFKKDANIHKKISKSNNKENSNKIPNVKRKIKQRPKINKKVKQGVNITNVNDNAKKPKLLQKTSSRGRNIIYRKYSTDSSDSDKPLEPSYKGTRYLQVVKDDEFMPDSLSESSTDSDYYYQRYNDNGKRMKRPDRTVYPVECEECNYEVKSKVDHYHHYLDFHRDKEYPYIKKRAFICHICGITKTTKVHLQNHVATHGEKKCLCDVCGKKFYNKQGLYSHKRRHATQLICDYCNKVLHAREDLKLHIRTHTGEKPYPCHLCDARFAHKGNVGVHIRSYHQHQPLKKTVVTKKSLKKKNVKKKLKKDRMKRKEKKINKINTCESTDENDDVPLKTLKESDLKLKQKSD